MTLLLYRLVRGQPRGCRMAPARRTARCPTRSAPPRRPGCAQPPAAALSAAVSAAAMQGASSWPPAVMTRHRMCCIPSHAGQCKAMRCSEPLSRMATKDMCLLCRYAGRACEACAAGFQPVGGRCVPIFQLLMPPPASAPRPSAAAPVRPCSGPAPLGIPGTGLQSCPGSLWQPLQLCVAALVSTPALT